MSAHPKPARTLQEWPADRRVYLTLDLECDFGTALSHNVYHAARQIDVLIDLLERHGVPLTVFLQTELFEEAPEAVARLRDATIPIEVHPHTHTHPPRSEAEPGKEIETSVEHVRERFDPDPLGFRFPDGATRPGDPERLRETDVDFDASLFPTRRPGRFDNADAPQYPFVHDGAEIVELPFTVLGERISVPVSLSYLKLLGRPFEWAVRSRPPSVIVFDLHMHDLVPTPAVDSLPPHYQLVYARNASRGPAILDGLLEALAAQGYTFGLMSELYEQAAAALSGGHAPGEQ